MATPNMALTLPSVLVTPGPDWATQLNAALTLVDEHDHTAGKGKQIPSTGIGINADLSFNGFSASLLKSLKLSSQSAALAGASNYNSVYVSANELFYNDSAGNAVQLTSGGAINVGSIGSITGMTGTASASFSSGTSTFTWLADSSTSTLATLLAGSVKIQSLTLSGKYTDIARAAGGSDWVLTLPNTASGSSTSTIVTVFPSGNVGYYYLDDYTLEQSGTLIGVKNGGVKGSHRATAYAEVDCTNGNYGSGYTAVGTTALAAFDGYLYTTNAGVTTNEVVVCVDIVPKSNPTLTDPPATATSAFGASISNAQIAVQILNSSGTIVYEFSEGATFTNILNGSGRHYCCKLAPGTYRAKLWLDGGSGLFTCTNQRLIIRQG